MTGKDFQGSFCYSETHKVNNVSVQFLYEYTPRVRIDCRSERDFCAFENVIASQIEKYLNSAFETKVNKIMVVIDWINPSTLSVTHCHIDTTGDFEGVISRLINDVEWNR